jgi:plasmid stability protein
MNVTIKDFPAELLRKIKAQATAHKRSLNWEVIDILERSLETKPVNVEALIDQVQYIHKHSHLPLLTDESLQEAKRKGQP